MTKRIEYLDAMRGLAMLLVVIGHTFSFGFKHVENVLFQTLCYELEIPLFFFVSGMLFREPEQWSLKEVTNVLKKRFFVLCIPAALFMLIYTWINDKNVYHDALFDNFKNGYWFTFTLFEFVVIYVAQSMVCEVMRLHGWMRDVCSCIFAVFVLFLSIYCIRIEDNHSWMKLIGMFQFQHYVYFVFGIMGRKFQMLDNMLKYKYLSGGVIVLTFLLHLYSYKDNHIAYWGSSTLWFMVLKLTAILVIWSGFSQYASWSSGKVGGTLQYIGRYTLDIYFIHYFFLPRNLSCIGDFFRCNPNPFIEFGIALVIAAALIAVSILVGKIIRLNSWSAYWMLGVKEKNSTGKPNYN